MTKEELIKALRENARPNEKYIISDELHHAMEQLEKPFELVEPILDIIGTNPETDFGMPGDLVHFVECFCNKGYEELLVSSVKKNPTGHNIWMLNRVINGTVGDEKAAYISVLQDIADNDSFPQNVRNSAQDFLDYQKKTADSQRQNSPLNGMNSIFDILKNIKIKPKW